MRQPHVNPDSDPALDALEELRATVEEMRTVVLTLPRLPMTDEDLQQVCHAAAAGTSTVIRAVVKSELRRAVAQEVVLVLLGMLIGGASVGVMAWLMH